MADTVERLQAVLADRYRIERELGHGGMATVFLAEDVKHHRRVAIKVLDPEVAAAIGSERFLREIEVAAGLSHPHILPLHDSGSADGLLYYVMPYAEGESLRERLELEKQLPVEDALRIARAIADALDYAHRHGLVHRDIKPENILFQEGHALVADFGIVRAIVAARGLKPTTSGLVLGTAAYMSPEQSMGVQDVDGRSDLYSLACVVYEMLGGKPPFTGPTAESLVHQHLSVAPRPVTDLRPTVPEAVSRAVSRALAKAPADRFSGAARFAEALTAPAEVTPERGEVPGKRRPLAVTLLALALAVAALAIWSQWASISTQLGWHAAYQATRRDWIMVAEFDGPPDDPSLAVATRDLVSAALDQSANLATVSRDQIRMALQLAGKPPATRVDAALARELAYRKGIRAVVEGSISRVGAGSAIVVRVLDVERDSLVLSVSDVAPNEKALIPTIGRVTRRIREGLGERKDAIRRSRQLLEVRTASFEAFKAYERAFQMLVTGDSQGAIDQSRAAIALDPDFAAASDMMGYAFNNIGQVDSASAAWRYALSRPGRLSDTNTLLTEAALAELEGNLPLALATLDRLVQLPNVIYAHNNRGWLLYRTGQYQAALGSLARATEASPFGPSQIILLNQFYTLLALGRLDEARAIARELREGFAQGAAVWLAAAAGNWALTESLGAALDASPTASRETRRLGALAVASAAAARGEVRVAEHALRRAEGWVGAASIPAARVCVEAAPRARLLLAMVVGEVPRRSDVRWPGDSTTSALVTRGLWAAIAGDTIRARRLLDVVRSRPAGELRHAGADPALLEGWIASQGGRWADVIRILGPAALQGSEIGLSEDRAGRVTLRWLVARAYESLGRADSAAAYYEMVLSPLGRADQEYFARGITLSFAHQRLVMLYARLGRREEARRHWGTFSRTFTRPDPALRPLIEEARMALASAEGMTGSARRQKHPGGGP